MKRLLLTGVAGALFAAAPMASASAAPDPAAAPAAAAKYEVFDLGTLPGGQNSQAVAVNTRGDVAGTSDGRPVLFGIGSVVDLGLPPGISGVSADINESGMIVGTFIDPDTRGQRGFRWTPGSLTKLPPLDGDTDTFAVALNDRGEAVGTSLPSGRPTLWRADDTTVDLSRTTRLSRVKDLDDNGQLVGEVPIPNSPFPAPALVSGTRTTVLAPTAGTTTGINGRGVVTGFLNDGSSFTWAAGRLTRIPPVPGDTIVQAADINNAGQVVGTTERVGFVYDGTSSSELPGLNGRSTVAGDINDRGQIVGASLSTPTNPTSHAVLLQPIG